MMDDSGMTESELRDLLASNIQTLEAGLMLLKKEQYIPNTLGTKGFIDLYAKDSQGHHVLIELKRSNAAAREAIHEVHKYVEGVKHHFGARDDEIRVIVASTEWKELLVPFSRFVADTSLAIVGIELLVDEQSGDITASEVSILPVVEGRFIAPWHDWNWYVSQESLNSGIASIEACCQEKGICDYVIAVLQPPEPIPSEHQSAMWEALGLVGNANLAPRPGSLPELPKYQYIAYFAMQMLSEDRYLEILEHDTKELKEVQDSAHEMDSEERLLFLHESVTALDPRPEQDHYEIGYPAKFIKCLDSYQCQVLEVRRYGVFARNPLLNDEAIISELRGEDGATGQRFKKTLSISNRAHLASARSDISACLDQNPVWRHHILSALNQIEQEFPQGEVDVSIYNPATGIFTPYLAVSREDGVLYVPSYSLTVRDPEPVRMYYGALQSVGAPLSFQQLLNKYYDGYLGNLLLTMSWGGRESRDSDIIEDIGLAYRSFRCDLDGEDRSFYLWRDERWRASECVDLFTLFSEYLEKNEQFIRVLVGKIGPRFSNGLFDASPAEHLLDEVADVPNGERLGHFLTGAPCECDICGCLLSEEKYLVVGKLLMADERASMCADCFACFGNGQFENDDQLYLRQGGAWLQVAGTVDIGFQE